ncbi:hypothetical protein U1Q18_014730 [Sarracenia purpurea var. burkii]
MLKATKNQPKVGTATVPLLLVMTPLQPSSNRHRITIKDIHPMPILREHAFDGKVELRHRYQEMQSVVDAKNKDLKADLQVICSKDDVFQSNLLSYRVDVKRARGLLKDKVNLACAEARKMRKLHE